MSGWLAISAFRSVLWPQCGPILAGPGGAAPDVFVPKPILTTGQGCSFECTGGSKKDKAW